MQTDSGSRSEGAATTGTFFTADGLSIRYGIWSAEEGRFCGSVLLLNGRKEFLEKYAETIADLNRRGFDVFSFDWRGQGLSSRLLPDRLKGHVGSYADYLQDLNQFVEQFVLPAGKRPLIILAHSMGAHIALRFLRQHPSRVDRAVLTSPMVDIRTAPYPRRLAEVLARCALAFGMTERYLPGAAGRNALRRPFEGNPLTSDPRRFAVERDTVVRNPDLALGGPTFGWLAATLESIHLTQREGFLETISVPLLMVAAGRDAVVCETSQRRACSRMQRCRFFLLEEALHEVLMECDRMRSAFWEIFDRFIAQGD
jgi:lysophospholipase